MRTGKKHTNPLKVTKAQLAKESAAIEAFDTKHGITPPSKSFRAQVIAKNKKQHGKK